MNAPATTSARGTAPRREGAVLVVDDDEHVRRALRRVVGRTGCRYLEAPDAAVAIDLLSREPVQVVVSDYRMPGMDGVEFLSLVKERHPSIQRVLLTGQADNSAIEEAINRSEIFRFIWKPWDENQLILTIQDAVDQYWTLEENARLQAMLAARQAELEALNRELDVKLEARTAALRLAAQEWRTCFDAISDPVAILRGCEVVRANSGFAIAAGVAVEDLHGMHCTEHAFGSIPCPGPQPPDPEGRLVELRDHAWLLRSYPFGDGASVVSYKDVTQEREVTRRLFQAEKMSALGQLAGGVAHEINNPLGGILAFAQIMAQDPRSAEDQESLRLIADAAMRAKRIVESLLRFARTPKEHERGPVELSRVAEDALLMLQPTLREGKLKVVRDLHPARTVGNANQLQQVAVNLIVNAAQALEGKGTITVHTGPSRPGRVEIAVADDGPGVPPGLATRIFEPFFTTKPEGKGTGLGLAICYRIAEEHGGAIRLESPEAGGARFVVDLPVEAAT